ncbi:MAG: hypothetical protein ACE5FI_00730 [Anaerolineales bacterium]
MTQDSGSQPAPAPEGSTRYLLLFISFIIPVAGIAIGLIYLQRPDAASQAFGRQALIAAVAFFVLFCLCFACYFIFVFGMGLFPLLLLPFTNLDSSALLPVIQLL